MNMNFLGNHLPPRSANSDNLGKSTVKFDIWVNFCRVKELFEIFRIIFWIQVNGYFCFFYNTFRIEFTTKHDRTGI